MLCISKSDTKTAKLETLRIRIRTKLLNLLTTSNLCSPEKLLQDANKCQLPINQQVIQLVKATMLKYAQQDIVLNPL